MKLLMHDQRAPSATRTTPPRLRVLERERLPPVSSAPRRLSDSERRELSSFDRALASLTMAFQPIVRASGGELVGFEALMRPQEPEIGNPTLLLEAAERLGRLDRLGRSVRDLVGRRWRDVGADLGDVFVNLHASDLLDPSLSSPFSPLAALRHRVVLEITERAPLSAIAGVRDRVAELRELGYRIAIDDLGAGHRRMRELGVFGADIVKLDWALVRGIDRHLIKRDLVRAVIDLCHERGIVVVGECVETEAERDVLEEIGCDLLQGFLIARPDAVPRHPR